MRANWDKRAITNVGKAVVHARKSGTSPYTIFMVDEDGPFEITVTAVHHRIHAVAIAKSIAPPKKHKGSFVLRPRLGKPTKSQMRRISRDAMAQQRPPK